MTDFFAALTDPDIVFLRYAFFASILASIPFGIMGTYVVTRRISYIAGAIAHCALGGIGTAVYIRYRLGMTQESIFFDALPIAGAVIQALAAAIIIGLLSLYGKEREDTVIGAVWALGMAQGLVFMAMTPEYVDPMSYLFGGIIYVSAGDLVAIGLLTLLVAGTAIFFYNKLVAVCFDEEFAHLRGVRVQVYYLLLLCLTAVTVVLLLRVVGVVMVIALLTLPAAVAGHFAKRIWQMMLLAILFCIAFTTTGLGASYALDLPSGPVIIIIGGATYLATVAGRRLLVV